MPTLNDELHLNMLREFRAPEIAVWQAERRGFASWADLERAIKSGDLHFTKSEKGARLVKITDLERLFGKPRGEMYGLQWGDPESTPPVVFVKSRYVLPYINPGHTALEIGPGGGRWTQYLVKMKHVYAVDYHDAMFDEVRRWVTSPNLTLIKNNGTDFPGVPDASIDFLFSFDVFVHLDADIIAAYLDSMKRVLKPGATGLLHYSDQTKIMARENPAFADMTPERMRGMLQGAGYEVVQEDTTTMWHSSIVLFRLKR